MEENKSLGHIMLDLETFGTDNDSVICSIGAVEFDIVTGQTGREFYQKIDIQSCLDAGLKVSGQTILWWMKQSDEARRELYDAKPANFMVVLHQFREFVNLVGKESQIWGNSNRFDMGILQTAYQKSHTSIPWDFRKERDVRTLVSLKPEIQKTCVFDGVAHNPIADCHFQIKYCTQIWNVLMPKTKTFTVPISTLPTPEEARKALMDLIAQYKAELPIDTTEWTNMPEGILLPEKPKNIEEARKAIQYIIAEFKDEILLDQNWVIQNILLPKEYVD